ncbi:DeoR/GlpR family DNA-binding transcription regulator [Thermotoga sp. KOL6]|uniref:DeoR/GlpR family DNA-binding transcription regulator n=1 Tax=Thermotoga sp. KOL6 TaxID=126741 RepID=UPI000C78786C|nr:DeoR/GlpR family DNA-binding transcription regulator [Thermotoga sp. KOL6]PLV59811.1 DeoR family transcriptional regulator [Thermotoga sp. KOL6]
MREKRLKKILEIIESQDFVSMRDLQKELGVSMITVRRDVAELVKENLVKKVHGGIKRVSYFEKESDFMKRLHVNREAKERIAELALNFVEDNDIIFLDASTTLYVFARYLALSKKRVHVITNSIPIAMELSKNPNVSVFLLMGKVNPESMSVEGALTIESGKRMSVKKAFVSCRGVTAKEGTYEINTMEMGIKSVFIERSEEVYVLADSSKIGKRSLIHLLPTERIDCLITEKKPIEDQYRLFVEKGVKMVF